MSDFKEWLDSIPSTTWTVLLLIVLGGAFFLFIKFNAKVLSVMAGVRQKLYGFISNKIGGGVRSVNKHFRRTAFLNRDGLGYKIYRFFDDIIVDLGLSRNGVTVIGLLSFIAFTALLLSVILAVLLELSFALFVTAWGACFVLELNVFRFIALTNREKRETDIMDAVDLLVSDVKEGVANAVTRYMDSFHPSIRPDFLEFIDNMNTKNMSFRASMSILNDRLGYTFSDFAHKAILYEEKADEEMVDIFSAILETNRHMRYLRNKNNIAFKNIMMSMTVSFIGIMAFAMYIITTEPMVQDFLLHNAVGKFMILADIIVFVLVLGYLTGLKAKSFEV